MIADVFSSVHLQSLTITLYSICFCYAINRQFSLLSNRNRFSSTSESWGVNGHTTRCIGLYPWSCSFGWYPADGYGDQRRPIGPWDSWRTLHYTISPLVCYFSVHPSVWPSVFWLVTVLCFNMWAVAYLECAKGGGPGGLGDGSPQWGPGASLRPLDLRLKLTLFLLLNA